MALSSTFKVVSIDPGVTTGLVKAKLANGVLTVQPLQLRLTPFQFLRWLEVNAMPPTIIICEDFEFRPKSPVGLVMTSAHLIGVAMAWSEWKHVELRMQNATYAKAGFYGSIANLKKAGVYVGGKDFEHSMDAMRHFMQWLYFGPGYKYNKSPQVVLKK